MADLIFRTPRASGYIDLSKRTGAMVDPKQVEEWNKTLDKRLRAAERMYAHLLRAGELPVQVREGAPGGKPGKRFVIKMRTGMGAKGFGVIEPGRKRPSEGYKMLGKSRMLDWLSSLEPQRGVRVAMNVGKNLDKAIEQAIANAKLDNKPRYIHMYGGNWWVEKSKSRDSVQVNARDKVKDVREKVTKKKGSEVGSEDELRKQVIKVAYENPGEVRDALLPLLREAAAEEGEALSAQGEGNEPMPKAGAGKDVKLPRKQKGVHVGDVWRFGLIDEKGRKSKKTLHVAKVYLTYLILTERADGKGKEYRLDYRNWAVTSLKGPQNTPYEVESLSVAKPMPKAGAIEKEAQEIGPESRPAAIITAHALADVLDPVLFWLTDVSGSARQARDVLTRVRKELRAIEGSEERQRVGQTVARVRRVVPFKLSA